MASSGKPLGEPELAVPPGPNIILLSGMLEVTNDQVGSFFFFFFFGHHKDALQGKNGLGQWPRPENPWDTHQLTCAPGPKTILLSGMREEHVTTLAVGVNVHL